MNEQTTSAPITDAALGPDQVEAVAGGTDTCTVVSAIREGAAALPSVYESLIGFTSGVIERVVNATK